MNKGDQLGISPQTEEPPHCVRANRALYFAMEWSSISTCRESWCVTSNLSTASSGLGLNFMNRAVLKEKFRACHEWWPKLKNAATRSPD